VEGKSKANLVEGALLVKEADEALVREGESETKLAEKCNIWWA
jgi:hypothetical protein